MIYLITTLVFISVILMSLVFYQYFLKKSELADRIEKLYPYSGNITNVNKDSEKWTNKLNRIGKMVKISSNERSKYTKILVAAGYRKESVYLFLGSKVLMACFLPSLYFFYCASQNQIYYNTQVVLILIACAICGYLLPSHWIYVKKARRQEQIFHTLPDMLDLITICVEAGLSIDASLLKAIETPEFSNDPLAGEIKTATMETRAGKPRSESLQDMADRTMVDDVKSFVIMLTQAERFGTSISQSLRSYADSLRIRRRQIAEEAAAKTAIKMTFPLVLFILPALLVVVLGPALVQIAKVLK